MQISDVVEEGRVEYLPVVSPALGPSGPSNIRASPSKWMRKISRSSVKLPRKFEILSPPVTPQKRSLVEYPSFTSALTARASRGMSRRSGWDRIAAPNFRVASP